MSCFESDAQLQSCCNVIADEQNVTVCVLDMTSHLTNQNAIDWAKEADPAGRRTLGIVTKPDRAVSADTNALDQLESGAFLMGLGYVVVSCRTLHSFCRPDKGLLVLQSVTTALCGPSWVLATFLLLRSVPYTFMCRLLLRRHMVDDSCCQSNIQRQAILR